MEIWNALRQETLRPPPCTPLALVYRHRHAQLRNTTSSTTSQGRNKSTINAHERSSSASSSSSESSSSESSSSESSSSALVALTRSSCSNRLDDSSSSTSSSSASSSYSAPLMLLTVCHPLSILTRLLPIMLHLCDHCHYARLLPLPLRPLRPLSIPRPLPIMLHHYQYGAHYTTHSSSSPSWTVAKKTIELSQKKPVEPSQKTLVAGHRRKKPSRCKKPFSLETVAKKTRDFLVRLLLFEKNPVTVAKKHPPKQLVPPEGWSEKNPLYHGYPVRKVTSYPNLYLGISTLTKWPRICTSHELSVRGFQRPRGLWDFNSDFNGQLSSCLKESWFWAATITQCNPESPLFCRPLYQTISNLELSEVSVWSRG